MTKILCVDDEELLLRMYSRFLPRAGYEVVTASDGKEALRILTESNGSIDGIFTDDSMPIMRGLDLIPAIRKLEGSLSQIPIVVVCSSGNKGPDGKRLVPQDYLNAGAQAHIKKPFSPDQLLEAAKTYFVKR